MFQALIGKLHIIFIQRNAQKTSRILQRNNCCGQVSGFASASQPLLVHEFIIPTLPTYVGGDNVSIFIDKMRHQMLADHSA